MASPEAAVWVVVWRYRGAWPYIDFWEREDAFAFAQGIAESPDRCDPQVFQHETPGPDEETKARIWAHLQRAANGDALEPVLKAQK